MTYIRRKTIEGLQLGDTFSTTRTFTEQDILKFANISRDYNPVHFDERFAKVKHFNGRISHGLLVASMVTEIGGQIGWLASGMHFDFKKPVYFGDTIKCDFTITHMDENGRAKGEGILRNQHEEIVLEAVVTGVLPGTEEKRVMSVMVAEGDPNNKIG